MRRVVRCVNCGAELTRIYMGDQDGPRLVHAYTERRDCTLNRGTATAPTVGT